MRCRFHYEDGEQCADDEGHEEYAMACGHLRNAPPRLAPEPERKPAMIRNPMRSLATLAIAMSAGLMGMGRPESPRLPPLPPKDPLPGSPEDKEAYRKLLHEPKKSIPIDDPEARRIHRSSTYGRSFDHILDPWGGGPLPEMDTLLRQAEKRASDERHLRAAQEKRERRAKRRRGEQ